MFSIEIPGAFYFLIGIVPGLTLLQESSANLSWNKQKIESLTGAASILVGQEWIPLVNTHIIDCSEAHVVYHGAGMGRKLESHSY